MFAILIMSCIFHAAAIFNLSGKGLPPILFAECIFVLKACFSRVAHNNRLDNPIVKHFILFYIVAVLTTLLCPFLFEGIGVIKPGETTDYDLIRGNIWGHLSFTSSNVMHLLYLTLHLMTIISLLRVKKIISDDWIIRVFKCAVLVVCIVGFWEFTSKTTGAIYFPDEFFYSNEGYSQLWLDSKNRMNSTFTEASAAGSFLAASFWALSAFPKKNIFLMVTVCICLILNMSGTGVVSFSLFGIVYMISIKKTKTVLSVLIAFFILYGISVILGYDKAIYEMLEEKSESDSGLARMGAVTYTLKLIPNTYFLGVGLGSHRDFSFISGLVASVGIAGCLLFFRFLWKILSNISDEHSMWIRNFAACFFIAQCIAIPDFSFPVLWMWIFMAIALNEKNYSVPNISK